MHVVVRLILPIALAIFALDRISKIWIVDMLDLPTRQAIDVVPPFLNFRMAWNTGINFGIGGGGPEGTKWILIGLSVVISAALLWWVARRGDRILGWGAGAVIGGALGNAWDRFQWGAVADFLNMSCCGINNPFSFNVADIAIFAGAIWIAWKA
ncbi:MAG: signal peptidase II [Pseudomonadota bacterium]